MLPSRIQEIKNDGECFYTALILSLKNHPSGNLLKRFDLPSNNLKLRRMLVDLPGFNDAYANIFALMEMRDDDLLLETFGQMENFRLNNSGQLRQNEYGQLPQVIGFPSPWMSDFYNENRDNDTFTLNNFLQEAKNRVGILDIQVNAFNNGARNHKVHEFANDLDVQVISEFLENNYGIRVIRQSRLEYKSGDQVDFGTREHPIVYVHYNGIDHYDSIVPRTAGGTRRRKAKSKTRRRY